MIHESTMKLLLVYRDFTQNLLKIWVNVYLANDIMVKAIFFPKPDPFFSFKAIHLAHLTPQLIRTNFQNTIFS